MKKILCSLTVFFTIGYNLIEAQSYSFSNTTSTYTAITGGTNFLTDFNDSIMLGYNFTISGVTSQKVQVLQRGDITTGPYSITSKWFYPFGVETSQGQYSYVISGSAGNRITKIQYKNVKFDHEPSGTSFINYQVWLYEADNSIEVRFGSSSILDFVDCYYGEPGPFIGMDNEFWLKGTVTAPTVDITSHYLSGTPANGTVYRFAPKSTGIAVIGNEQTKMRAYPMPVNNVLFVDIPGEKIADLQILDMFGRIIENYDHWNLSSPLNVSSLQVGSYIVKNGPISTLFIKQ